jgi:hypothetical protein
LGVRRCGMFPPRARAGARVSARRCAGFPSVPGSPRCLHLPAAGENGAVCAYCRAQHGVLCVFLGHPVLVLLALSPVIRAAARPVLLLLAASSVIGVMSSTFSAVPDWFPLVSVHSRSRDGVFPTSFTSRLGGGVRSGKRRRHTASTSVQAAGGSSRNRGAQCPYPRARRCTVLVRMVYG